MDNKIQVEEPMINAWTSNSSNSASPLPFERLIIVYQFRKEIINQMPRKSLRIKTQLARLKNYIYTILSSKISHSHKLFKILGGDRPWRKKWNPLKKNLVTCATIV
jgi:hypothetical protein